MEAAVNDSNSARKWWSALDPRAGPSDAEELLMLQHTKAGLDSFMLLLHANAWQEQCGDGLYLFQHDCTPVRKERSIKMWMREFDVEELD